MSPKEAFLVKTNVLSNSSFLSHLMCQTGCSTFHCTKFVRRGCQGFKGPDPSTFRNENATILKEQIENKSNKKALLSCIQKGCVKNCYTIALMFARCTYTYNTSWLYKG